MRWMHGTGTDTYTVCTQTNIHTHLDVQEEAAGRWAGNTDFQQIVKLKTTQGRKGEREGEEREREREGVGQEEGKWRRGKK